LREDQTRKLFEHIALLENTNKELVKTLKQCVELLSQFKSFVPDPQGWQEILDVFRETIKVGERVIGNRTIH
jgi:hypothetical protein